MTSKSELLFFNELNRTKDFKIKRNQTKNVFQVIIIYSFIIINSIIVSLS